MVGCIRSDVRQTKAQQLLTRKTLGQPVAVQPDATADLLACSFLQLLLLPKNASTGLQVGLVHLSLCNQYCQALLHPDQVNVKCVRALL